MASHIGRRKFLATLGGAAAAWPLAARAQQPGKLPTIGFLAANPSIESQRVAAFVQRLCELSWIDGRNLAIEYRWAEGRNERYAENAAELVRLKVDVIVTVGTPPTLAAKQATADIPIVFAAASDPVGTGLVASLARPRGNVTGLSNQISDTGGRNSRCCAKPYPIFVAWRLWLMWATPPPYWTWARPEKRPARSVDIRNPASGGHLARLRRAQGPRGRTLCLCRPAREHSPHSTLALAARLPTMHGLREYVEAGGLMSYGPNLPDLLRRAADYVDKILRGAKPGDIPVEQPTRFDLIINLTTAKALGLAIPPKLLTLADEVIE